MFLSPWDAAVIAVKTVAYAATLAGAGAVFFLGYGGNLLSGTQHLAIRRLILGCAVLSVAAGAAQVVVTAGSMGGAVAAMGDGSLLVMVLQAGAGRATSIRAIGLLLASLGVMRERPPWWALLGAVMAATSFVWTGHAHALRPDVFPVLLLVAHLLGVAFWLGALAPLHAIARAGDLPRTAAAAARFGAAAVYVVGALVGAAAILLWLLLGSFAAIWGSTYGRYFILKLTVVAGLLSLAAYNKLRLTPRLRAGDAAAVQSLRASIGCELILGFLILSITAALTTVAGPPALD